VVLFGKLAPFRAIISVALGMKYSNILILTGTLLLVVNTAPVWCQQIKISPPSHLPLAKDWVSSECILNSNESPSSPLIATFLIAKPGASPPNYHTQVWHSQDQGQSWLTLDYPALPQAADPWSILQANGNILLADISEGDRFHLQTTFYRTDAQQWNESVSFGDGYDHCLLVPGIGEQSVYLIATQKYRDHLNQLQSRILICHSEDGGRHFPKRYFHQLITGMEINAKQAFIRADGTLMIPVILSAYFPKDGDTSIRLQEMHSWLYPFHQQGRTLGTPSFITNLSGRRHHHLVQHRQKPNHLYYAFTDVQQYRLGLTQSQDGGLSWSPVVWVYQDTSSAKTVDLSALAINKRGELAIAWVKKRPDDCYQRMISLLFPADQQLLSKPIGITPCPNKENGWVKRAWPQGGDYCGLVVNFDNSFSLLWSQPLNGRFAPHFTQISFIK